jgi:hypothetical protein
MKTFCIKIAAMLGLIIFASRAPAAESDEHRRLADRVFAAVIVELDLLKQDSLVLIFAPKNTVRAERNIWQGKSFGELCAQYSGDDLSRSRFHWRGKTILQQLRALNSVLLEEAWRDRGVNTAATAPSAWPAARLAEQTNQNVVANYFLHHYLALRFAKLAGEVATRRQEAWQRALIYEAMAQGYLADAFSAGHLLVPSSDALAGFNRINTKKAHDFFGSEGVFVINSRGEVWRTFGDKLFHWYAPTYRAVFEAGQSSVRELFLVYFAAVNSNGIPARIKSWGHNQISAETLLQSIAIPQDGEKYYTTIKLPTLHLLPMPVAASWSVRTDLGDTLGIYHRKHYPQLSEAAYHDPDGDGLDKEFLYPQSSILDAMIPAVIRGQNVAEVIKSHPAVASVRYVQQRNFPPSYVGLLLSMTGGMKLKTSEKNLATSLSIGYGLVDNLLLFKKIGVNLTFARHDSRRVLLAPTMGAGIKTGLLEGFIESFHFAGGYAWGLRSPNKAHGFKTEVGLESPTIPLGFTYSGVTVRLKYQSIALEKKLQGVFLELVLH